MIIASIGANTVTTTTVNPVAPVRADRQGQAPASPPPAATPPNLTPTPIASQFAPATVRALFTEAGGAPVAQAGQPGQVATAPAPAVAPLTTAMVASLGAQKTGKAAEPARDGRSEKTAKGTADPAKTLSETLAPETVSALIQTAQKHRDDRDDGSLLV